MRLAFIGSMNDEIIIQEELACDLLRVVCQYYPRAVSERYGWQDDPAEEDSQREQLTETEAAELLERIAVSRRCFTKGEEPDLARAAALFIDDFRSGRLGRMTLERR